MTNLQKIETLLQDGDVIFIRISNALYRRVAEVSRSWESHVGIVFSRPDGSWWVAESTVPVSKFTPVEKFVSRSAHGRFLVTRFKNGLSPEEKIRLRRSSESRMGRLYHLGFKYDSSRLYCSKFVHDVYREATGHLIGRLQTFRELLSENPQASLGFWRAWFFGFIPWQRRCVTTTSQLKAENFITVFDSTQTDNGWRVVNQHLSGGQDDGK